ncbi:MAG: GTPase ObgE [Candidatus Sumerlaeota bacterium]|nr:GTPase ObgE [Candidatus Sumerlaeota bacterium]
MPKFVDYARISVKAGDGGDGIVSFRREKFAPRGGPDGGDGGRGGTVIFIGNLHLVTLLDFHYQSHFRAPSGKKGGKKDCFGKGGDDLIIPVPLGCVVTDEATGETICDITAPGQREIVAQGGKGGRGNAHFATATNRSPRRFEEGTAGEERALILELKMIADVGLIGLPNAGKSTLLRALTAATPKVASYPFTTLHPNLGVLEFDLQTRLVLADLPGLIEGASTGAGLGDRFLRHIERTGTLLHLVTEEQGVFDGDDLIERVELVRNELQVYGHALTQKPQTIVLSQIDRAEDPEMLEQARKALEKRYGKVIVISAKTGEGLEDLRALLRGIAEEKKRLAAEEHAAQAAAPPSSTRSDVSASSPLWSLPSSLTEKEWK